MSNIKVENKKIATGNVGDSLICLMTGGYHPSNTVTQVTQDGKTVTFNSKADADRYVKSLK